MPTIKKIKSGKLAKAQGQRFEILFKNITSAQGFKCIQIPMGAKMISAQRMIRVATPFDFVLFYDHYTFCIDTKTTSANRFAYSSLKPHQVKELSECGKFFNVLAGYVVNFFELNKVVFYSANQLSELKTKSSLTPEDGIMLGTTMNFNLLSILQLKQE